MAPMKMDVSKGQALHRLYGHSFFINEAKALGKSEQFRSNVCQAVSCNPHSRRELSYLLGSRRLHA